MTDKKKKISDIKKELGVKSQPIRLVYPKRFLANLSQLLENNSKKLLELNGENQKLLLNENKKLYELFYQLKTAIKDNRVDKVEVSNFPEQKEAKINIPEHPKEIEIKEPRWYKKFLDKINIKQPEQQDIEAILEKHTEKENAFAVRLVDKTGKSFYDAMFQAIAGGMPNTLAVSNFPSVQDVQGDTAHDAADSGDPVKIGYKAVNFNGTAPPNAVVAEGDRVNAIADEYGRIYVGTIHPNYWDVSADYAAAQTNTTVKAAPGAGLSLYLTDIAISNGATAGNITLLDGAGGTVLYELYVAINGGGIDNRNTPIKLTANTLLAITSTGVTTHSVTISGFIAP